MILTTISMIDNHSLFLLIWSLLDEYTMRGFFRIRKAKNLERRLQKH